MAFASAPISGMADKQMDVAWAPPAVTSPTALSYFAAHPRRPQVYFGDYLLLQTLGEGEFGKVKLGVHRTWGEETAIKLIKRDRVAHEDAAKFSKVEREIQVLRALRHPNIVHLYEVIESERYIGIVLEYGAGGELFDYILAHKCLKERDACRLFAQLISGVSYLHKKNIIHRDLKLENLLLDRNRNVIITDFGFANDFSTRGNDLMATSCGSPCYAAPELVVQDGLYVGAAVDVWSCGVILYAMLAGYLPFDDDPANPDGDNINMLYKYIMATPLTFPDYVGPEPRSLLARMLVPDPSQRATLDEVMAHPWLAPYRDLFCFSVSELEHAAIEQQYKKRQAYCEQMLEQQKMLEQQCGGVPHSQSAAASLAAAKEPPHTEVLPVSASTGMVSGVAALAAAEVRDDLPVETQAATVVETQKPVRVPDSEVPSMADASAETIQQAPPAPVAESAETTGPEPAETTLAEPAETTLAEPAEPTVPEPAEPTVLVEPAAEPADPVKVPVPDTAPSQPIGPVEHAEAPKDTQAATEARVPATEAPADTDAPAAPSVAVPHAATAHTAPSLYEMPGMVGVRSMGLPELAPPIHETHAEKRKHDTDTTELPAKAPAARAAAKPRGLNGNHTTAKPNGAVYNKRRSDSETSGGARRPRTEPLAEAKHLAESRADRAAEPWRSAPAPANGSVASSGTSGVGQPAPPLFVNTSAVSMLAPLGTSTSFGQEPLSLTSFLPQRLGETWPRKASASRTDTETSPVREDAAEDAEERRRSMTAASSATRSRNERARPLSMPPTSVGAVPVAVPANAPPSSMQAPAPVRLSLDTSMDRLQEHGAARTRPGLAQPVAAAEKRAPWWRRLSGSHAHASPARPAPTPMESVAEQQSEAEARLAQRHEQAKAKAQTEAERHTAERLPRSEPRVSLAARSRPEPRLGPHVGAVDPAALTTRAPEDVMRDVLQVLHSMGIEMRRVRGHEMRIECVRAKRKNAFVAFFTGRGGNERRRSRLGGRSRASVLGGRPSVDEAERSFSRMSMTQAPGGAGASGVPASGTALSRYSLDEPISIGQTSVSPLFGDPSRDGGHEVRFSVEITHIPTLRGLYSVDIRRLKGNVWSYKFLYDSVLERLELGGSV